MLMKIQHTFRKFRPTYFTSRRSVLVAVGAGVVVLTALVILSLTRASGFFASTEPDSGTLSGNATAISDAQASGGRAVQFNAPVTGGGGGGGGGTSGCAVAASNVPDGHDPWGGCWPGPSTTGVPAGTALTTPTGLSSDGNLVVATPNAVVSGIDLTKVSGEGGILVQATGVTIKNSKVRFVDVDFAAPNADGGAHPTVIQDTEFDCNQAVTNISTAVYYGNYTLRRVKVHDCENGLDMGAGHVYAYDSYWYHLYQCPINNPLCTEPSPHTGVVQGDPGANSTMTHNWMEAINLADCVLVPGITNIYNNGHCNGSGVIGWNNQGGGSNNVLINRNMMVGGAETIRCPKLTSTNFVVTDNRMHPEYNIAGVSSLCAPYDAHDNRDATTNAIIHLD